MRKIKNRPENTKLLGENGTQKIYTQIAKIYRARSVRFFPSKRASPAKKRKGGNLT
jgi:hypothetical protein